MKLKRNIQILAFLSLMSSIGLFSVVPALALSPSITLSSSSSEVALGSTVVVAVYMNAAGNPVNAVETDLAYPSSELQYVGINYSGSAFSINTPTNGGGNGSVSIQNGTVTPITGSGLVATVTFKALVNAGSAAVTVAGSSNIVSATTNTAIPYTSSGTVISFGSPVYHAPVYQATTASSGAATTTAPATPMKSTTPPVLSHIVATKLKPNSVTITWTTNEPSDSEVSYGLSSSYGLSASTAGLTEQHVVTLSGSFILAKSTMHYRVSSTDSNGNVATSTDHTVLVPGVPVVITVVGPTGKPQPGAFVTLDNSSGITNPDGRVILSSATGNEEVITSYDGQTVQMPITVATPSQNLLSYKLDFDKQPAMNRWILATITLVVLLLLFMGFDAYVFRSRLTIWLFRLESKVSSASHAQLLGSAAHYIPEAPKTQPSHQAVKNLDGLRAAPPELPAPEKELLLEEENKQQ